MQHLVVRTANPNGLVASDWVTNGVNRKGVESVFWISDLHFGFWVDSIQT